MSPFLSPSDLAAIHGASMALLARVGVIFHHEAAIDTFRRHGARTEGHTVFLEEKQVMAAVAQAPARFTIRARNPARDVTVGDGKTVFAPGYGAPFIFDQETGRRKPTMADYEALMRLAHALPHQDLSGHMLVQPADLPDCQVHLHMLRAGMVYSDKPFIGSSASETSARQTMEMAATLFDVPREALLDQPVTMGLVDSLSPLTFSREMAGSLMAYARWRQPLLLASLVMAGATGPITLAGALAQQNAELLAGLTLAQLTSPGTPVVYCSASTNMDMRTGALAVGSPELSLLSSASLQMARFYGLPGRVGGALTDAHTPDAQAGFESLFGLLSAAVSGADFVLHAGGVLSSFLSFSFEKLVLDDELCGRVRRYCQGFEVNPETLALDVIAAVGPGGNFLSEQHTVTHCRQAFWQPAVGRPNGLEEWLTAGRPDAATLARQRCQALLAEHVDPPLDAAIARRLDDYVTEQGC